MQLRSVRPASRAALFLCALALVVVVAGILPAASLAAKATPTIFTNPSRATLGGAIHDEATVEGRVDAQAGEEVEFDLYPPSDPTCVKAPVYTNSVSYAAGGEPTVSSGPYTTTETGAYHWTVIYSGDADNEEAESVCEAVPAGPDEVFVGSKSSRIQPIDIATNVDGSPIGVGSAPEQLAVSPDQETAYVANHGNNSVSVIDTATNTVTATITGFSGPQGVAFDPTGGIAYVADGTAGKVSVIDTTTNAIIATIPVGSNPWQIAFTPDGSTAYVTNSGGNSISAIDVSAGSVTATIAGFDDPKGVVVTPDGRTVYVANDFGSASVRGTVTPIATATNVAGSPIAVPANPVALAATPDGREVLVASHFRGSPDGSTITPIDTTGNTPGTPFLPCSGFGNFGAPLGIAVTPDGQTIYTDNENNFVACRDSAASPTPTAPNYTYADSPVGVAIAAPMRIGNATTLSAPTVGASYSQALWSVGGTYPMTYSKVDGSLPPGVSLSSSGVLSGSPTAAGSYTFTVQSSDSSSVQQGTAKTFDLEVKKAEPTISTTPRGPVTVGATIEDEAKVEGRADPLAGSSVEFRLYPPSDPTCSHTPIYTHTAPYAAADEPQVSSGAYTTTEAGIYHWSAIYFGDTNNQSAGSTCAEASTVSKAAPTLSTNASPGVIHGGAIKLKDTATLASGYSPGGTVTFRLYGPDDSSCTGGIAFEDTEAVAGAGAESGEFTPTAAGTYRWVAEYSGDANNDSATDGCNGADESVTVAQDSPTISISFPLDKEHFALHQNVTPGYSCSEPLGGSSAASCTATPIDTSTLGPHLFTVTAVDKVGNESTKTVAYVVDPPRYGDYVMEDHPLAYYRLDEPLGSNTMVDSSGNHHDGEYKNGVVLRRPAAISCERRPHPPLACNLKNDPQDSSAYFPARDGYGYANGITAPTQEYSIEAWVKPTDGQDMMIAAHGGGGQLFISGGHLAFRQTQDTIVAGGADGVVPPGQWSYVAATWDGHISRLYVDGQEVTSANWANKEPSGSATFYVGYGDQAPWFHGYEDEVAYYGQALGPGRIFDRWQIGTAYDHPSPTGPGTSQTGPENTNTALPYANIDVPVNNATYAPTKVPVSDFDCSDLDGPGDIASCEAELNGVPIHSGDPLPQGPGSYSLKLTATDIGGNVYTHTHTFTVEPYADVVRSDHPIAYYRLGDTGDTMADSSGDGHDGTYENDTESGPVGISGDGDHARLFEGQGGYGYVDGITAPTDESSLEAWVYPYDGRDEAIVGHGDAGELDIIGGHFSYRRMETTLTAQIGPGGHCAPPTPKAWTHVAGTWDGVTMRIYVDGELCGEVESTRRPSSSSTFYVGFGELAPWFHGAIDEVGYYPTGLSGERVHEHYIADPPPAELASVTGESPAGGEGSQAGEATTSSSGSGSADQGGASSGGTSDTAPAGADGAAPSPGPTVTKKSRCARRKGQARKVCLKRARGLRRHR